MHKNRFKVPANLVKTLKIKGGQLALGLTALGLLLVLYQFHFTYFYTFINRLDGVLYDYLIKLDLQKKSSNTNVVLIDIDDYSIQKQGRWPWPRDKFVILLDKLKKAGVAVVAFDIVFSEAEINYALGLKEKLLDLNYPKPPELYKITNFLNDVSKKVDNDQAFANALKQNDVVLGFLFQHDPTIKKGDLPKPLLDITSERMLRLTASIPSFEGYNGTLGIFLKAAPHTGFVTNIPELDGVIRHGLLLAKYNKQLYSSLSLSIVMQYLLADNITLASHFTFGKQVIDGINVGSFFIPTNTAGQILIPFWDNGQTIPAYSANDIIENDTPPKELAGSIVIIGSSMVLLSDLHQSPISQSFPGMEMVANMVSGILGRQIIQEFDWNTLGGLIVIVLTGSLYAIIFPFLSPFVLLVTFFILIIIILFGSFFLLLAKNYYIASTILLLLTTLLAVTNFLYDFILERHQKNRIRRLFDMYVPPSYVKEIMDYPNKYSMDGENREMTVFFADIRGFTTLSETLDASELKHLLNEFFTPITNIIFNHQGTIDKYVGDMVMAFWGAPIIDTEHSWHALQAALDIRERLEEINDNLVQKKLPSITLGMGLSSGMMNVGDMGSSFRRSYTVIGDEVNLASRLQDLTKFYQVDILVSETTRANINNILWRPIDKVAVKGRQKALIIYEPIGYHQDVSPEIVEELNDFEKGLNAYYKQDWVTAKALFTILATGNATTYLYQLYLQRVDDFCNSPPPEHWNGIFIHTRK